MSDICPVVRIKADNEDGFIDINKSDFDAEKHELFEAETEKVEILPLYETIKQLIEKGDDLKDDGYPRIGVLREACGNKDLTQEDYDSCIKEHFPEE